MGDQLSQSQIDDLLKKMASGEPEEEEEEKDLFDGKVVKEYDFNSPKKFTKEQLKVLEDLHESFSRLLSTYFTSILRTFCEIEVLAIEEQLYYDFNSALPDQALIGMIEIRPKEQRFEELNVIMNVTTDIGFFIVERLLGGADELEDAMTRNFTDLEASILTNIFSRIAGCMQDAWITYMDSDVTLSGLETNSRLMQSVPPKEVVVLVMLSIKLGNISGNIDICIPANALGDLFGSFNNKYQKSSKRKLDEETRNTLVYNIVDSDIEVKAVLSEFYLDVQELLQIQLNDIIPLNKAIDSDVCIKIDGEPWFEGKIGEVRQRKAIKLNHLISQDSNIEKRDFYGE